MQASWCCHTILFLSFLPFHIPPNYVSSEAFAGYIMNNGIQGKKYYKVKGNKTNASFVFGGMVGVFFVPSPLFFFLLSSVTTTTHGVLT